MRKLSLTLTLATMVAMVGCQFPGAAPPLDQSGTPGVEGGTVRQQPPALAGRVTFAARQVMADASTLANGATVSLINTGNNETVSTALTNASGEFVLNFSNDYLADPTATYFLEVVKGQNGNQPGHQAVRLRTVAKFKDGWTSITSASPNAQALVSPATTALALGAGLVNGQPTSFDFATLIGSLSSGDNPAYTPVNGLSGGDFDTLLALVEAILADGQDPLANAGRVVDGGQAFWRRLNVAPAIAAFAPAQAQVGDSVTVSGTGFSPVAAENLLSFNGAQAPMAAATAMQLTASVPVGATSGPTALKVGAMTVLGPNFSVLPVVNTVAPLQGLPGTVVTLTGTGFNAQIKTNNLVEFNGVAAAIQKATATELEVVVPAAATNGDLTLTVNGLPAALSQVFKAETRIQTVAGTRTIASTQALQWQKPYWAMVADSQGNLYATAADESVVYKITPAGILTTIAGDGEEGFGGDGGRAIDARLNQPRGLALDGDDTLYVADTSNHRIRKIDLKTGTITTVAGDGGSSFFGDGGSALAAQLNAPQAVAVDANHHLLIADSSNRRIRRVDASTGTITTVAGGGKDAVASSALEADIGYAVGLALDGAGNLYVSDGSRARVGKVDLNAGTFAVFAINLSNVRGLDLYGEYLFVAWDNRVSQIHTTTRVKTDLAGTHTWGFSGDDGPATSATLNAPHGVAFHKMTLYIADMGNNRIRRLAAGKISTIAGAAAPSAPSGGSALGVIIGEPLAMAEHPNGDLYIATEQNRIWKLSGGMLSPIDTGVTLNYPLGLAVDAAREILYIADTKKDRILRLPLGGGNAEVVDDPDERIERPHGLAVDADGNLFIANTYYSEILKLPTTGPLVQVGGEVDTPNGLAVDAAGNVYVASRWDYQVFQIRPDGATRVIAGNGSSGYSGDGGPAVHAGLGYLRGLALDRDGNVYVTDDDYHVVRKIDMSTGLISTVVGTGTSGFASDGAAARRAALNSPKGLLFRASGELLIVDSGNGVVRSIGF